MKNLFIVIMILFVSGLTAQNQIPEVVVQMGHISYITSVAFSPDGKYIASGSEDNTVKLWEVQSGKEIKTFLGHSSSVLCVSFSPDGKYIASGGYDNTVRLWEVETGKEINTFKSSSVLCVSFSPDGKFIACGGEYSKIQLWEIQTGREVDIFFEEYRYFNVWSLSFSSDGRYIAIGSSDSISPVKLWDNKLKKGTNTFVGNTSWVLSVSFSPDRKIIASGSRDSTVRLWDIQTGREIYSFKGHTNEVTSVSFSPDGKYIASGSRDNKVKLWEVQTGKEINTFSDRNSGISSVSFSPDGKYIASGDYNWSVNLWEVKTGKLIKKFEGNCDGVPSVIFSPNGEYIASGTGGKSFKLWEVQTGRIINTFKGHSSTVGSISFSPDGKYIASGSLDSTVKLWEVQSGKEIKTFKGHSHYVYSVSYSPDGKYIASGSWDKTVRLWDVQTGKEINKLIGNIGWIYSVSFSPDGKYIAGGGYDNTIKIWEVKTGKEIISLKGYYATFASICFSPDGKYIAGVSSNEIKIWEVPSGKVINTIREYSWNVFNTSFSPDGKYFAKGGENATVKIWEVQTGKEINTFKGHSWYIYAVRFSPDGKYIVSGSADGRMKIWDIKSEKEIVSIISFSEKEYINITPDNYYLCSKHGLQAIGFVIDNHSFPPEQFDLQYNRPDIVLERIGLAPKELIEAYRRAYQKRLKKMKFDEGMFNKDFHMPEMKIMNENIPMNTPEKNLSFKIKAEDSKYNLDRINVYVNDVSVYGTDGIDLRDKQISTYESNINLELSNGKNKVQISVLNEKGVESLKETFEITCDIPALKHDLFVVTIGASDYNDSRYKLNFAAKDAKDIGDLFLNQKDKYNDIKVLKLLDKDVTRENILKAKEFLMQSKVDDEVIVFIGGHGLLTKDFDYYFATADIDFINPQNRGVTFEEIESLLDGIPARQKVLLMDTCHSGELDKEDLQIIAQNEKQVEHGEVIFRDVPGVRIGRKNENEGLGLKNTSELMQEMFVDLRRGSGAAVISSSGGLEVSFEGGGIKNGLFTYCIIEGLKTQNADFNKDGKITVSELRDYVSEKVEKLTKGTQKPTSRKENLENDFRVW